MKELIEILEKRSLRWEAKSLKNGGTTLSLSCNKIGDAGASSLAASLKDNKSLTSLDLGNNDIVGFLFFWLKAFVTQHSLLVNTFPSTFPLKPV